MTLVGSEKPEGVHTVPSAARPELTPRPAPPTMKDVSRLAGVSQSTVSRVLSGAFTAVPITPETRDRVLRAAEALRYRPHPLARGLRGAGTALLGLIVRDIADPFFTAMLKGPDPLPIEPALPALRQALASAGTAIQSGEKPDTYMPDNELVATQPAYEVDE